MAWSVLQSASGTIDGTAVSATFSTANVQAGNKIIAYCSGGGAGVPAISFVKDGAGTSWTQVGAASGGNARTYIYALDVPAGDVGTKPTITATWSGAAGLGIVIQEVSGLAAGNTTAMVDGTAGALTGSTSSTGSPTYSSSAANEFLVSAYGDIGNGVTVSTAGGWTPDAHNINASASSNCMVQYKNSTGGSETDGYTGADGGGWAIVEVAFLLASSAAVSGWVPQLVPPGLQSPAAWALLQPNTVYPVTAAAPAVSGTAPDHLVIARRQAARAVWAGTVSETVNAPPAAPPGTAPDHLVIARRAAARGVWRGLAVPAQAAEPASGRGAVSRRAAARAVWRPTSTETTNLQSGNQPGGLVRRRAAARGLWGGQSTPQPHVPGSVQPRATLPVPRRATARAVWDSVVGAANASGPAGTAPARASVPVPRRYPARGAWHAGQGTGNAAGPAGTVQPRPVIALPRRYPSRALWRSASGAANASGPSGFTQPRAAVPVPRRTTARAVWDSVAGPGNAHGPGGLPSPHLTIPRRVPSRAAWRGFVSSTVNHAAAAPGVQQWMPHPSVSRRTAARAVQAGTVTRTVNAIPPAPAPAPRPVIARRVPARAVAHGSPAPFPPPSGTVQPAATAPARHRAAARVIWRGGPVPGQQPRPATGGLTRRRAPAARGQWHAGAGAPPPATTPGTPAAGKSVTTRRPPSRGQWRGTVTRTSNALPVAVSAPKGRHDVPRRYPARGAWHGAAGAVRRYELIRFTLGAARGQWQAGDARQVWAASGARQTWTAGPARNDSS